MELDDLDILQGYTIARDNNGGEEGSRTLYWLDDLGRYHRAGDYPAVIKLINGKVVERTWYKEGVEHRGLGRPTFYNSITGEERYVDNGRPYDPVTSIDNLYQYNPTRHIDRKIIYDMLIDRYFLETAIHKKDVVEYAQSRLRQINTTQACHAVNITTVIEENPADNYDVIQETSSTNSDYVFRFEEGSSEPLNNDTLPDQNPGRVHNYVIIFSPRENNPLPESHIEFLAMNLVEVRSNHAHILLSKFAPRFKDFKYLISGECIFNPKSDKLSVNIQSGMNWQLNLSRFSEQDLQNIKDRMKSDIVNGNLEVSTDHKDPLIDYAYILLQDILRGRGPKNDLFGAIAELYFSQCLGYEVGVYETKTFRGQTKEDLRVLKQWCDQGVGIRVFDNKKICDSNPTRGRDFCAMPDLPKPREESSSTTKKEKKIDYKTLTVAQLQKLLNERDIVYPPRARKNQLIELLSEN